MYAPPTASAASATVATTARQFQPPASQYRPSGAYSEASDGDVRHRTQYPVISPPVLKDTNRGAVLEKSYDGDTTLAATFTGIVARMIMTSPMDDLPRAGGSELAGFGGWRHPCPAGGRCGMLDWRVTMAAVAQVPRVWQQAPTA